MPAPLRLVLLATLFLLGAAPASGQTVYTGTLGLDPATYEGDRYVKRYPFEVQRGQFVTVTLRSTAFDPYLYVDGPGDTVLENDDLMGSTETAQVSFLADTSGTWTARATSYAEDATGDFTLEVVLGPVGTLATYPGALTPDDARSPKGEYYDTFTVPLEAGRRVRVEAQADDFFPYLLLTSPSGTRYPAPAYDEAGLVIERLIEEGGDWTVHLTSEAPDAVGPYLVRTVTFAPAADTEVYEDALTPSDKRMVKGEYYDTYTFDLAAGDTLALDLSANDFDTFLIARSPGGFSARNDDAESSSRSRLTLIVDGEEGRTAGTWTVFVTSYLPGETGAYRLVATH